MSASNVWILAKEANERLLDTPVLHDQPCFPRKPQESPGIPTV